MPIPVDFILYLITDRRQAPDGDLLRAVQGALEGGVRAVQLREKDLAEAVRLKLAQELRLLTRSYGARLLVNSSVEVALAAEADGVHLPGCRPEIAAVRHRLGPDRLIGVSTHSREELEPAAAAGADFVTFGPVFATPSKLPFGDPVGLEELARASRTSSLPVMALGGVDLGNLPRVKAAGAAGFACIRPILAAPAPGRAAAELLACWQG